MRSKFTFKIRLIAISIILVALVLLVRLYFLQIVHGAEYRASAEAQYVKQSENQVDRGSIFFKTKDGALISAATLGRGYTVVVNPSEVRNANDVYGVLSSYISELDKGVLLERISNPDDIHEEIARKISDETGNAIQERDVAGIELQRETWRFYPGGSLAAHSIGFLGYGADGTTLSGQYGLERFYDTALTRSRGGLYVNFFADLFTNIRSQFLNGEVREGADLITSIEPTVQQYLEGVITRYDDAWYPRIAGGIIMDPKTGAIIALAAAPTFDPNNVKDADPNAFAHPLVERVYEFGSTMKPLTMAAGIDAGAVTPKTTYNDLGYAIFDGARISNFDGKGRGVVQMQEVLNQSLNTGMAFVVDRMGTQKFREYFEKFGITEETGIDLPNEQAPLVENFSSPRKIEYVTAAFGQGIALTPIAMTRALATLANYGVVPGPHVGVELDYGGGITKEAGWSPERRALKSETAETITRMLVEVVDTALKGGQVMIPEYTIAAKTGTAQIAKQGERGYYDDRYLHSFFGYFPAYEPQFIIFLFATEPVGARYASETWTDPFMEIVKFLINYYNIPPDRAPDIGTAP